MHELSCPSCGTPSQYNLNDTLQICQFCSRSFTVDIMTGVKEVFGDHYIVPNLLDGPSVREAVIEWLKRIHHRPGAAEKEFVVLDIRGISLPFWITSCDVHTVWKGLVKRQGRNSLKLLPGSEYLLETGQFRRTYRWAVSARTNLCETWGVTRLHEPKEPINVEWDGFPLDSTFSRGRIDEKKHDDEGKSIYDQREFFDYKYSNGLAITGVQVSEEEALRRAKLHCEHYHYRLANLAVDYLVDIRTEFEVAGVQLIHLPFWHATYQYRPRSYLRHFYKPKSKNVIVDGHGKGILKAELAIVHRDKVTVNAIVCAIAAVLLLLLGISIHPAFYLISVFAVLVSLASMYVASIRQQQQNDLNLEHGGLGAGKPDTSVATAI